MACRIAALTVALVAGTFSPTLTADEKMDNGKDLQGTWAYESMEWDGKQLPAAQISATTITFEGNKFIVKVGDKVTMAGTFKLDPAKSPKAFDAVVAEGAGKGNEPLGIYELDGDTLTGCVKLTGRARPTEFKSKDQSDTVIVVAKRVKK